MFPSLKDVHPCAKHWILLCPLDTKILIPASEGALWAIILWTHFQDLFTGIQLICPGGILSSVSSWSNCCFYTSSPALKHTPSSFCGVATTSCWEVVLPVLGMTLKLLSCSRRMGVTKSIAFWKPREIAQCNPASLEACFYNRFPLTHLPSVHSRGCALYDLKR